MIRIFNHYVHRAALRGIVFDLGLVLLVALVAVSLNLGSINQAVPLAGTHVLSFAACFFVINSASGLYEATPSISAGSSFARAFVVLLVALPLCYLIFGMLPAGFSGRSSIQISMMVGVSALIYGGPTSPTAQQPWPDEPAF